MSTVPQDLRYTKEHEWARVEEDGSVTVGVTYFAQEQLGDVVFLDLPEAGTEVGAGESLGEIESTKSVSEIYSPIAGKVAQVNEQTKEDPGAVNNEPYGQGWLVRLEPADASEVEGLLSAADYESLLADEGGEG